MTEAARLGDRPTREQLRKFDYVEEPLGDSGSERDYSRFWTKHPVHRLKGISPRQMNAADKFSVEFDLAHSSPGSPPMHERVDTSARSDPDGAAVNRVHHTAQFRKSCEIVRKEVCGQDFNTFMTVVGKRAPLRWSQGEKRNRRTEKATKEMILKTLERLADYYGC